MGQHYRVLTAERSESVNGKVQHHVEYDRSGGCCGDLCREINLSTRADLDAADHLVESPANILYCIYNETDRRARILVVKTPKPTRETKIL